MEKKSDLEKESIFYSRLCKFEKQDQTYILWLTGLPNQNHPLTVGMHS